MRPRWQRENLGRGFEVEEIIIWSGALRQYVFQVDLLHKLPISKDMQ
jgi:hypothetical protein